MLLTIVLCSKFLNFNYCTIRPESNYCATSWILLYYAMNSIMLRPTSKCHKPNYHTMFLILIIVLCSESNYCAMFWILIIVLHPEANYHAMSWFLATLLRSYSNTMLCPAILANVLHLDLATYYVPNLTIYYYVPNPITLLRLEF